MDVHLGGCGLDRGVRHDDKDTGIRSKLINVGGEGGPS